MKKRWLCLALAALMVLSCTGCGAKQEAKQEGFSPRLDTDTQAELNISGFLGNFEALDQVVNAFNEIYPNVSVHYESNGADTLREYVTNNPQVDIFMTADRNVRYVDWEEKYVGDCCADLSKEDLDLSAYNQALLKPCTIDGALNRLPLGASLGGMVVNESLLEKEGLKLPTDYESLLSVCEALKEKGYTPIQGASTQVYAYLVQDMVLNTLAEKNQFAALREGNLSAAEAVTPALERLNTLVEKGYTDPAVNDTYPEDNYDGAILRFLGGDVPFWVCNTEKVSGMKKRESKSETFASAPFTYSFRLIPMGDTGAYEYLEPWYGFSLNKNSEHYDIALEFLRFLSTEDQLNTMADVKGIPTACVTLSEDSRYAALEGITPAGLLIADGTVREHMTSFLGSAARALAEETFATPQEAAEGYVNRCGEVEK